MTRRATASFAPTTMGLDEVKAYHGDTTISTLKIYVFPKFAAMWDFPSAFEINQTSSASVMLMMIGQGLTTITASNFKLVCSDGTELINEDTKEIQASTSVSFKYTPTEDTPSSVYFTISFDHSVTGEVSGTNSYTFTSNSVPVVKGEGTYNLSIVSPPLTYDIQNSVKLLAIDSDIPTGETINFKSTYGLDANGTLKDGEG